MIDIFSNPKKNRVKPTKSERNEIWDRQRGKCFVCSRILSPTTSDYHHKDGNPSNWRIFNIVLVCLECHRRETNKQRVKKIQKKRGEREKIQKDPLGLNNVFKSPRKKDSIFGF